MKLLKLKNTIYEKKFVMESQQTGSKEEKIS